MPRIKKPRVAKGEVPDLGQIRSRLEALYSERNTMIEEMRDLRFMENDADIPQGMEPEEVRAPIGYQVIERMVGTLTVERPHIHVPPRDQTGAAQAASSRVELATAAVFQEMPRQNDDDVWERFIESLLADGWGCMRLMHAPQVWSGYPDREDDEADKDYNDRVEEWVRSAPLPFNWSWVDPLTIYPLWGELGLSAVLEIDQRDPLTLGTERFNNPGKIELSELTRQHSTSGSVEFAQLWTEDTLTYWVNGEVVHHQIHTYRRPPYIIARGVTTSSPDPEKAGLSILYPVRHILPYLDRLLSQKATAVRMWCWPTPIFRAAADTDPKKTVNVDPGKTVVLKPREELSFLVWQGNAPDVERQVAQIMDMVDRATISQSMYGESYAGDSGYLVNQLIAAARMKFRPLVAHAERAKEQLVQLLWDIVETQIQRPLYVYTTNKSEDGKKERGWIALDPDDIKGYRQVRVTVNPLLPTDTYARTSRVLAELNGGVRSVRSAMEEIGIEQPDMMLDEIQLDRWLQQPQVQEVMIQEIIERFGILEKAKQSQVSAANMMGMFPNMPPALQQAIMAGQMGGMGQAMPNPNMGTPGIFAAPGVQAIPTGPAGGGSLPSRPAGVAQGIPTGPRMVGEATP